MDEKERRFQALAGIDRFSLISWSYPVGFVACQPANPAASITYYPDPAADSDRIIEYYRLDLMFKPHPSARNKLRIANLLIVIPELLLIALLIASCTAVDQPGSPAPTPTTVKTFQFVIPTGLATGGPFIRRTPQPTPSEFLPTSILRPASLQEKRLMSIEWPSSIRVGDSDIIRLTMQVDNQGVVTPSVEVSGHQLIGREISIPNLYDLDNIIAEARLDMAGLQVSPDGAVRQTMLPGQDLVFYWSISPSQSGTYRGTLWVYLDLIPKAGGEMDQRTLIAHRIDIQSNTIFGLSAATARWFGAGGAVFSSILGFPFIEKILEKLWGRLHTEKAK
ncbi:MAG: hypothetical protein P4L50_02120 [Anaerolineaceae bacterium]|nr:hypothetical protein [Anaerolineaceae bacterium]